MNASRLLLALPLLAALAAPALASQTDPPSGTMLSLTVGEQLKIKVKGTQGCTFDFSANVPNPSTVDVTPPNGLGVKSAVIQLVGLKPGATLLSIDCTGGSCEPSLATFT